MFPNSRLLRLASKSHSWLALTVSLGFISGLLTILQARWISQLVSRVFLEGDALADLTWIMIGILAAFCLRAVLAWGTSLSAKTIAVQVKTRVRDVLLDKIESLGPAALEREQSGELSSTLVEGVESLDPYFSQYLPQLVLSALVPLSILLFVFPMDLLSGAVLLVTAPLIPYFMYLIGSGARKITDRQYSTLSRLAAQFLDSLQGLRTLKLFNQARAQTEKIRETSDQYRLTTMKVLQVTFLSALALELLATLSTAVVAVEIGLRLLYYRVALEQALFLLIIAPEFYIPLRLLGLRFHAGMEGQSAAGRIFQVLDQEPQEEVSSAGADLPAPDLENLEFKGVSFEYPGGRGPALQGIDLSVSRGQAIALVGASGAGKSTLASLLLRFISPSAGTITLNGIDLAEIDPASWRQAIAWVPQQPAIFQGTIAANIRLARPDANDSAVAAAASAAHLADFIDSLPDGYQTVIGEGGARLSGGQAQRLALARAFLKDAPILILDEPTSQLDPITESQLADATRKLMAGKTVLTIAHRLNTIFQADRILVLDQGRIAGTGVHDRLMADSELYRDLVLAYTGFANLAEGPPDEDLLPGLTTAPLPAESQRSGPLDARGETPREPGAIRRLLSFFKPYYQEVLASALLGTMTISSSIGLMGASAWLIVTASTHPSIAVLQVAIVGVRFFGIARGITRYLERLVSHNLTFKILTELRVWFYRALVPLAPARTERYQSGDLLSRITSDIKTLEDFYVRSLGPPLVAALVGLGTGIFLYGYLPALAWLLWGLFALSGALFPLLIRRLASKPGRELVQVRGTLTAQLVNFLQGLPDLLIFGQVQRMRDGIRASNRQTSAAQLRLAWITGLNAGALILFSNLAMWITLMITIPAVRSGAVPGEMLAALALMVLSAFEAVQPLPQAMETLASSRQAGERLLEILDAEPAVRDPDPPGRLPEGASLDIRDLSFRYPGSAGPALERVSFQLQEGELLALVGPSGSGKSTLANLLVRFWGGYEGEISLGKPGRSLKELAQDDVRGLISAVPQRPDLFQETLGANIALGKPGATPEEIAAAARAARLEGLIAALPEGLDTQLGERGSQFSAGERQRIAIARAVLKDAPIYLLDEPTANLDPLTERALLETLFGILAGRTALLITHRLVGLGQADRILVLQGGRVIESGTERELLARPSFYRRMWTLQNRILSYS